MRRDTMSISDQKGSAALAECLTAFGGVVGVLCTFGVAPVAAVLLSLFAAFALARV